MNKPIHILFVDDQWCGPRDRSIIEAAYGPLQRRDVPYGFHYETAEDSKGGYSVEPVMEKISSISDLSAVILDIMFGDDDRLGLDMLAAIREKYPILPVIMLTSVEGKIDVVERAMELGANEYLIKKPSIEELETTLRIYTQPSISDADYAIWGNSEGIRHVRALIARVAFGGTATVLITGESGVGKELVARAIHRQGPRRSDPFIDKNCAYEKSDLLDDDLFGHEKGAFTGAEQEHIGRIERANRGVLFLDEIGDMSTELQGKLLRVLETRHFQRIGGEKDIFSDFQLICATNKNPDKLLADKQLREDLYFRLKQFDIWVPPLRERVDDIPILANFFLKRLKEGPDGSYLADKFSGEVIEKFKKYSWPGNARELKNVIERAIILSKKHVIELDCLPPEIANTELKSVRLDRQSDVDFISLLSDEQTEWHRLRIIAELRLALEAKRRIQEYKGKNWKAEFMRLLYPACKAQNAKGFNDLIRRLTKGPWGKPNYSEDKEIADLIDQLKN